MNFASLLVLGLLSSSAAVGAESLSVDRDAVWFKPSLSVNSAPVCAEILRVELDTFFSLRAQSEYAADGFEPVDLYKELNTVPQVEYVKAEHGTQLVLTRPDSQRIFAKVTSQGGCGGACETQRILVADKLIEPSVRLAHDDAWPSTPRAPRWRLYKAADGEFYAIGMTDDDRSRTYRLASPTSVEPTCEVILKPEKFSDNDNPAIQRAWQSMEALRQAYGSVSQEAGNCGSLRAHDRKYGYLERALKEALYRPWNSRAPYDDDPPISLDLEQRGLSADQQLEVWALGGMAEYRAWQRYRAQVDRSIEDIGKFYRQTLAWPEAEAREQAAGAIRRALDSGFAFSSYYRPAATERPLRRAILERQPLAIIKQLELGERSKEQEEVGFGYDSILNVAIEYPEVLQYLLSKGFDPNAANAFGKTPLMYAAQYNQLESARILLAAGADPNAETHIPEDDCYYTLRTSGMTPLHYAVRYASAPVVLALIEHGSFTFSRTKRLYPDVQEYPLDWLNKHTGDTPKIEQVGDEGVVDKNPNIRAAELPALFAALRVPSDEERERTSGTLVTRGQAEYARGDFRSAYRSLKLALAAQPTNEKALADLPLVAFRAGEIRDAISSARQAITASTSAPLQAAAWYNMGLICEREEVRKQYFTSGSCDGDWIWPFVQAWKLQPTQARADKLRRVFAQEGTGSCSDSGELQDLKVWSVLTRNSRIERIHILHIVRAPLDIEPTPGTTRVIDNLAVRDQGITVLERAKSATLPRINGRACHMPKANPAGGG